MAADEGLEASMASVKLQETEHVILIRVRGTVFSLDERTVGSFQSDFLNTLIDPESTFQKSEDGVYNVDANEECFSVFLHMVRYRSLPTYIVLDTSKESVLIREAGFWGIETKVQAMIKQAKRTLIPCSEVQELIRYSHVLESPKVHHNCRIDDSHGFMYCAQCQCDDRGMASDWWSFRTSRDNKILVCRMCETNILHNIPDLEWCHRCSLCTKCQSLEPGGCLGLSSLLD